MVPKLWISPLDNSFTYEDVAPGGGVFEDTPIFQGDAYGQAGAVVGQSFLGLGHYPGADLVHGLLNCGIGYLFIFERANGHLSVHQGGGDVVLGAKLALQGVVWLLVQHQK